MWLQLKRISKPNAAILLFGTQPFTSKLIISNLEMFRYCWVWNKRKAANFLFGNKQPLKLTEDIAVFYEKQPFYNPIKRANPNGAQKSGRIGIGNTIHEHLANAPERSAAGKDYESDKLLPTNIIEISKDCVPEHPTQKPVALMEYLINTYTRESEVVLDFTTGSGTTGVAAVQLGRQFLGFEIDPKYCRLANERIEAARKGLKLNEYRQGQQTLFGGEE
jgi:site-specific DNA-methyltransferase (adenine-specific)